MTDDPKRLPIVNAGEQYGQTWTIVACRRAKRGEIVYHGAYDRIARAPDDSPHGVCDCIVEFLEKQ